MFSTESSRIQEEREVLDLMKAFDSGEITEGDFLKTIKSIKECFIQCVKMDIVFLLFYLSGLVY